MFVEGQDPRDAPAGFTPPAPAQPADPFYSPSPDKVIEAAFRQNNPIASVLDSVASASPDNTPDPTWNPLSLIRDTPYEQYYLNYFRRSKRSADPGAYRKINAEERDRETLAASGWARNRRHCRRRAFGPIHIHPGRRRGQQRYRRSADDIGNRRENGDYGGLVFGRI